MKHLRKFNEKSQDIIDDILSVNEGFGGIFDKFKSYARKGLLTAAIVISVALSSQAQQQNPTEVIKNGTELLQNNEKQLLYCFMVGITSEYASKFMRDGSIENSGALIEICKYYQDLRDGKQPLKLSKIAQDRTKFILDSSKNLDENIIKKYMEQGKTIYNK